jgi:hypothetical protein
MLKFDFGALKTNGQAVGKLLIDVVQMDVLSPRQNIYFYKVDKATTLYSSLLSFIRSVILSLFKPLLSVKYLLIPLVHSTNNKDNLNKLLNYHITYKEC